MNSICRGVLALVLVGSLAACGSDAETSDLAGEPTPQVSESAPDPAATSATSSDDARPVPTTDELAAALLIPAVLGEGWEVLEEFGAGEIGGPGKFCHDSQDEYGEWHAETGMAYGRDLEQAHWLVLGQRVTSGEPAQMQALFDEMKAAMEACHGAEWDTIEEGHLRSEVMDVPAVGQASVGLFVHSDGFEASDDVIVVADVQQAAVLDGPVLTFITLSELREPRLDPIGAEVDFTEILTDAVNRLPR